MRQLPSFDVYISFYFLYFKYLLQKIQISNALPAEQGLLQIVLVKSSVVCTFSSTLCHNYHIPQKFSVSYVRYRTSTSFGISPYKSSSIVAKTISREDVRNWRLVQPTRYIPIDQDILYQLADVKCWKSNEGQKSG